MTQQHLMPRPESDDRRSDPRVRLCKGVKLLVGDTGRYVGGHTLDISASGLRVRVPGAATLRQGSHVQVVLDHPSSGVVSAQEMIPARIVWSEADEMYQPTQLAGLKLLRTGSSAGTVIAA
jgi:hypothetical protein